MADEEKIACSLDLFQEELRFRNHGTPAVRLRVFQVDGNDASIRCLQLCQGKKCITYKKRVEDTPNLLQKKFGRSFFCQVMDVEIRQHRFPCRKSAIDEDVR